MLLIFIVCLVFILLEQTWNLNHIKQYVKIKIFVILFKEYQKSDKTPVILYADLECLIKNIDGYKSWKEHL